MKNSIKGDKACDGFTLACRLALIGIMISFFGWVLENIWRYALYNARGDRGLLHLPICPIYGVCIILSYLLLGTPRQLGGILGSKIKKSTVGKTVFCPLRCFIFYFLLTSIISTVAELITGLAYRAIGITLWDYSERSFNLFGVVCLGYSLLWGLLITLFFLIAWTPMYRLSEKIPPRVCQVLACVISTIAVGDFLLTTALGALRSFS